MHKRGDWAKTLETRKKAKRENKEKITAN